MRVFGKKNIANLRSKVNAKFTVRCLAVVLLFVCVMVLMNFYYGYPFLSFAFITDKRVTDRLIEAYNARKDISLIDLLKTSDLEGKKVVMIEGDNIGPLRLLEPQCFSEETRKILEDKVDSSLGGYLLPPDHMGVILIYNDQGYAKSYALYLNPSPCLQRNLTCLDAGTAGFGIDMLPSATGKGQYPCYNLRKIR